MSASISRLQGRDAYDLIYPDYLSKLSDGSQEIMHRSMMNSTWVWVGYNSEGKILCVWGVIPPTLLSDVAYLWMYNTEHLKHHVFLLVRHSQRIISEILETYPLIVGHAAIDNPKAIRWLKWLGAQFSAAQGSLIPFEIKAKQ